MANFTETIQVLIDTETSKATAGLSSFKAKIGEAEGAVGKLKTGASSAFDAIGAAGPAALAGGAAAVGAFAVKVVGDFQNAAQGVLHFQQIAGGTAEDASRWVQVFDDYGVSADDAGNLIGKFAKTVGQTPDKLEALGIAVVHAKDGTVDLNATFLNAIDAMNKAPDAASRAAIGAAAFGKQWQSVSKLVADGAANVKADFASIKDSQVFDQSQLKQSEEFRLAIDNINDAIQGLEFTLVGDFMPILVEVTDTLARMADGFNSILGPIGGLGDTLKFAFDNLTPFGQALRAINLAMDTSGFVAGKLDDAYNSLTDSGTKGAVVAIEKVHTATDGHNRSLQDSTSRVEDNAAAMKTAAGVQKDATQAQKDYAAGVKEANDQMQAQLKAFADQAAALAAQADSLHAAADSQFAADKAARDLSQTFEDLPDKIDKINKSSDSQATKTREVQQAYDDAADAASKMADANVTLAADQAKATGATQTHTGALDTWNATILTSAANADGPLRTAIINHIAAVNGIPAEKVTEILASTPNLEEQKKLIDAASAARKLTIEADADTSKATAQVNAFILATESKTAYIDVVGRLSTQGQAHATGGSASGFALVGELGPELVSLPMGSYVYTAAQTKGMLAGMPAFADGGIFGPITAGAGAGRGSLDPRYTTSPYGVSTSSSIGRSMVNPVYHDKYGNTMWTVPVTQATLPVPDWAPYMPHTAGGFIPPPFAGGINGPVSGGGPATVIHLTVNAGIGTDGASVGRQIVNTLVEYNQSVGPLPVSVRQRA